MKQRKQTRETRRTHSLGGCEPCRRRHKKCDQALPTCERCRISGDQCERLSARIQWMPLVGPNLAPQEPPLAANGLHKPKTRRLVESHQSRLAMCKSLTADIPTTVDAVLYDLEEKSKTVAEILTIGPFGVLKVQSCPTASETKIPAPPLVESCEPTQPIHTQHEIWANPTITAGPSLFDEDMPALEDSLQWGDLFSWDAAAWWSLEELLRFEEDFEVVGEDLEHGHPATTKGLPTSQADPMDFTSDINNTRSTIPNRLGPIQLLPDAPLLLKHYDLDALHHMSALPLSQKSPWRILHIPAATITLSELTLFETDPGSLSHANLSLLYGLLAASAYHLSVNPHKTGPLYRQEGYWSTIYNKTFDLAKHHLDVSVQQESRGPNKVKYKEQLMAMNSTMSSAFVSNNQLDIEHYLVEWEKIIRYRGLAKKKISRRARFLHHIYAWVRIVSESTRVIQKSQSSRNAPEFEQIHNSSAPQITLDDFLGLKPRVPEQRRTVSSREEDICSEKEDIHLISAKEDAGSLYKQIYGIPETWLRLLSHSTRLANVLGLLNTPGHEKTEEELEALQQQTTRLEAAICNLITKSQLDLQKAGEATPHSHMLRALCAALLIYFYQRIRKVSPMILQGTINEVILALREFDKALEDQKVKGTGTSWPAFIAGSESISPTQRDEIMAWIDAAIQKTGFDSYKVAKTIIQEVWRRRDRSASMGGIGLQSTSKTSNPVTWIDVCQELQIWPLLC